MMALAARILAVLAAPLLLAAVGCDYTSESKMPAPPATDVVLAQAMFADRGGQATRGTYRIERTASGDLRLVLADDFKTDGGPDLHVVLSPTPFADAGNANALAGGAARIVAPLMHTSGGQVYDLPDDLDLAPFRSVLVHCVQFRHLFGAAPLTR